MYRFLRPAVAPRAAAALLPLGRACATNTAAPQEGGAGSSRRAGGLNRAQRSTLVRQRVRRALLPPAFDVLKWNDEDIAKGHMLRVLHRDSFIVLDYHKQTRRGDAEGPRGSRGERVVTVTLPPVYIARFLGVLEGRMPQVEVQSRYTNATFAPNKEKGDHHYTLRCTSTKPTTGQQQTADGADVKEETLEWAVDFDPAESLMLERFLSQALHYNTGFGRRIF